MENTLRERAKAYEPKTTKNVSDLKEVNMDEVQLHYTQGTTKDGEIFEYAYIKIKEEDYRIPNSVLEQLKQLDEEFGEDFKKFKVKKTGEGMSTKYQVVRLD